jgi:hypothetical protein
MKVVKTVLVLVCVMAMGIDVNAQAAENGAIPNGKMQPLLEVDSTGRDWKIMYGLKVWANEWSLPVELGAGDKTYILEYESDSAITPIPAFLATYRNFFIGGSYLLETDYDFPKQQGKYWYINDRGETVDDYYNLDISGSRTEWDLNIGYFLTPNIAVSLGYKNLERDLTLTTTFEDIPAIMKSIYPLSVQAPIIGISTSAPVSDKFNLYGNLAYGWLSGDASYKYIDVEENETETNDLDVDGNYLFGELGFGYFIPLEQKFASAVTINVGYRFQRLDMKLSSKEDEGSWGHSGDQHDSTAGFILGVGASY